MAWGIFKAGSPWWEEGGIKGVCGSVDSREGHVGSLKRQAKDLEDVEEC